MQLSYLDRPSTVKSEQRLPSRIASFYRWLHRWHAQTGDVHPSTPYFARKQKVSERTIYRWLAVLRDREYIVSEVDAGVERRIIPQKPPQSVRSLRAKMSGDRQGSLSGVPTSYCADASEATTEDVQAPAVRSFEKVSAGADGVSTLCQEGVPQSVAVGLVVKHGPHAVQAAILAYRQAKNVRNVVGWLVRAIERRYQFVSESPKKDSSGASKRVFVSPPPPPAVDGLVGKAAFDSLRSKLSLAGRVS